MSVAIKVDPSLPDPVHHNINKPSSRKIKRAESSDEDVPLAKTTGGASSSKASASNKPVREPSISGDDVELKPLPDIKMKSKKKPISVKDESSDEDKPLRTEPKKKRKVLPVKGHSSDDDVKPLRKRDKPVKDES